MSGEGVAERASAVLDEIERVVVGKRPALELIMTAVLARVHVLIEDLPGLGKTLIARSFAGALGLGFRRVQFTPSAVTEVAIFPNADRISAVPRPMDLPDLLGVHLGRRKGDGVEFAGLREYQPGDPLRSVNWPVSARRGQLYVTERLAEQAAKVVTMIDASGDVRQAGGST